MAIKTILAETTQTAAYNGASVDISAAANATYRHIVIRIKELKATSGSGPKSLTLQLQHVTAADFTTPVLGPAKVIKGTFNKDVDHNITIPLREYPTLPLGVANGKIRLTIASIEANASVTLSAWFE